jgi:integrase
MTHSKPRRSGAKPRKPRFPLWLHPTGQYGKVIRGRYYYFGTDRDAALNEYLRVKDDLEAGRRPPPPEDARLTLRELCNVFLTHKRHQRQIGEIAPRTFDDYYTSCEQLLGHLGKNTPVDQIRPEDLLSYRRKLGERRGAVAVGNEVRRVRVLLRFAFEAGLVGPIRVSQFKPPGKAVLRRERAARPPRMFQPDELRRLLEATQGALRAMILLGVNCGLGNSDCATLPISAADLEAGWLDYARPKTGIPRRCPLWPETVEALSEVLANRKQPKHQQYAGVVFITKRGAPWANGTKNATGIGHEFRKLLDRLGLHKPGLGFYSLRHVCQTVGDQTGDYLAVRRIMGHADSSISDAYRERFPDERLRRVAEHVHDWLFGDRQGQASSGLRVFA